MLKIELGKETIGENEKLVILTLGTLNNTSLEAFKIQAILFLLSNLFPKYEKSLKFKPSPVGPHSSKIDEILEKLVKLNIVKGKRSYKLTPLGLKVYKNLKSDLLEIIRDFKEFINDLSKEELHTFMYTSYPKLFDNAKAPKNRIRTALNLFKRGKVSFSKAVEISGLTTREFMDLI